MKGNILVDSKNKKIIVKMSSVSEKQLLKVKKYIALDYELVEYEAPKKTEYTKESIGNLLEKRPELLKIYETVCDEPVIDKETKKPKTLKDGKTIKKKGHIAGIKWYKEFIEYKVKNLDSTNVEEIKKALDSINIEEIKKKMEKEKETK